MLKRRFLDGLRILCLTLWVAGTASSLYAQEKRPLTQEQRTQIDSELHDLQKSIDIVPRHTWDCGHADAAIYAKAVAWALKYDQEFSPADIQLIENALLKGRERISNVPKKIHGPGVPLAYPAGKYVLGYVSKVDGSVQPYGLIVPKGLDPTHPVRLDVVLHGSMQPVGMSELKFMSRFDSLAENAAEYGDTPYIELHPLGRVENCYRWAGETDVFEAIEDVGTRFAIDRNKVVLRGMSMGASGTWHLGLKHPDKFVALGPYCGYVDTHRFSETPLGNFVKVGELPEHQELGLRMLDSVDYAANARMVPAIACMGEKDIFFDAHVIMAAAMRREGLQMVNLISPGTGHVIDPVTHAEQMRLIKAFADRGLNRVPRDLRFTTWTLKYSRCHWIQLLGLDKHYQKSEIEAHLSDGGVQITTTKNINRFAILTRMLPKIPRQIQFGTGDEVLALPNNLEDSKEIVLSRVGDKWQYAGNLQPGKQKSSHQPSKVPGLQGPIDDAFTAPFLCVQGTGTSWNTATQVYADARLKQFAKEWHHYFRGELPVKQDIEVTADDVNSKNLILFGDPGSNSLIAKMLGKLPLEWSKESIQFAGKSYTAADHLPAFVFPNPLPGAERNYVVLNSGHTFHESELSKLNYLLFPRWGDWAILKVDTDVGQMESVDEEVVRAGYFNEQWQLAE